jgi:hypothetical protein
MAVFLDQPLLAAASSLNAASSIDLRGEPSNVTIYIKNSAGVSAGAVSIEEADSTGYTGTWSVISSVTCDTPSVTNAVHLVGTYKALRTRISTAITGGTISTHIAASEG